MNYLETPVLFLIFNRPDLSQQVFARIREAKPQKLYIAADGPRNDHPDDPRLCAEAREVAELVDWECDVHTLFQVTNLGCKNGVSTAISWFFENVEQGIILEDDCLPHPSFFRFCAELLERFRDDERIMVISGNNFQQGIQRTRYSYYFSCFPHIWGWATWRRAWKYYDREMQHWAELRDTSWLLDLHGSEIAATYWRDIFDKTYGNSIDTWGYRWLYSCWVQSGLSIYPETNLVSNLGFDNRATHTRNPNDKTANLPAEAMEFPLRHPPFVIRQVDADQFTLRTIYLPSRRASLYRRAVRKIKNKIRSLLVRAGFVGG